jgi:hypothetical protein
MVVAPVALVVGLALTFLAYLAPAFSSDADGSTQAVRYAVALAVVLVPSVALIVVAAITASGSKRRVVGLTIGAVCAGISLMASGLPFVTSVVDAVEAQRLSALPLTAAETAYSLDDLRQLSAGFIADTTSTLSEVQPVRAEGGNPFGCELGNLADGNLFSSPRGEEFATADSREQALAAVAQQWRGLGYDVSATDDSVSIGGSDWLAEAEASWVAQGGDHNLVITYSSICVAD